MALTEQVARMTEAMFDLEPVLSASDYRGAFAEAGRELERHLSEDQRARIARAYREAGAEAVEGYRTVLRNLINERDRRRFEPGEAIAPVVARKKG